MHDERIAYYRKLSEGCVRRAKQEGGHTDEWAHLASHWELLARIRERMPIIADRYDFERDQVPNAFRG
jgi:hypothetical protein